MKETNKFSYFCLKNYTKKQKKLKGIHLAHDIYRSKSLIESIAMVCNKTMGIKTLLVEQDTYKKQVYTCIKSKQESAKYNIKKK